MTSDGEMVKPVLQREVKRAPTLDLRTRLVIRLGGWLLKALGATWRVRVHGADAYARRNAAGAHVVLVLWHGQILACTYAHKTPTAVIVSEHRDGEIIARILAMLGFTAVRGSSSRGGVRALLEAAAVLQRGMDIAITPDGPRGPRHSYAPGALLLGVRAGVPIVSITSHVDRAWRLRSWDAFEIPKPFARVTIAYSEPRPVTATGAREAGERTGEFAAHLHADVDRTAALAAERR